MRAAIKHSLGQYNIAPSIDFSLNPDYQVPITSKGRTIKTPNIEVDPNFNPFEQQKSAIQNKSLLNKTSSKGKHWEAIFEEIQDDMNTALNEGLNSPQSLESELNTLIQTYEQEKVTQEKIAREANILSTRMENLTGDEFKKRETTIAERVFTNIELQKLNVDLRIALKSKESITRIKNLLNERLEILQSEINNNEQLVNRLKKELENKLQELDQQNKLIDDETGDRNSLRAQQRTDISNREVFI